MANYANVLDDVLGNAFDHIDFSGNYSFDMAVTTSLCPLLLGRTVYVYGGSITEVADYHQHLRSHPVQFVKTTPAIATLVLAGSPVRVKTLMVGGEALNAQQVESLSANVDTLYDEYGPTETTVGVTLAQVLPKGDQGIGKPYPNVHLYILSPAMTPLPTGAVGELYVAGASLARGYINLPEKTAEQFVQYQGERVYKTGDMVRLLPDGSLSYCERRDNRVKVGGYRIELAEIERVMMALPEVEQALVVTKDNQLHSYIVYHNSCAPDPAPVKLALAQQLPLYMQPASYTRIGCVPLTPNGKVDHRALPKPEMVTASSHVAPTNELQRQLCAILAEVLGLERVGIRDDFFALGGNSMLLMTVAQKIRERLGVNYPIRHFYVAGTVERLAAGSSEGGPVALARAGEWQVELTPDYSEFPHPGQDSILLLGGTGLVGRHLLVELMDNTQATVVCLVRADDDLAAFERYRTLMGDHGLWQESWRDRLKVLAGDLLEDKFGLQSDVYRQLSREVATVYHSAGHIDHLATYEQLKAINIDGLKRVLQFVCQTRAKKLEYLCTNSIFDAVKDREVNELSTIDDLQHDRNDGYQATKWVAQKLVLNAISQGVHANIYRLGLVCSAKGAVQHDPNQWINRLITTCLNLGCCFAERQMPLQLTPSDFVAKAVSALSAVAGQGTTFHIGGRQMIDFVDLIVGYNQISDTPLQLVPFAEFYQRLQAAVASGMEVPARYMFGEADQSEDSEPVSHIKGDITRGQLQQLGLDYPDIDAELIQSLFANR